MGVLGFIQSVFNPAAKLIRELTTSKDEKLQLNNELEQIRNAMSDKLLEYEQKVLELQAGIVMAETKGNWLQRSWRPILMLAFGFVILYEYFFSNILSLPKSDLPAEFWSLLNLGVGGYVVGRSAEKIVPQIFSKNQKT